MNLVEVALIISVVVALYNIQQIKIILKNRGYPVELIKGIVSDYRNFKELIQKEQSQPVKVKYQKHLNGLIFSMAGIILFTVLLLS